MNRPLWFNAERANELVDLFSQYGNRCLYGHKVCPNPEHYATVKWHTVAGTKLLPLPIENPDTGKFEKCLVPKQYNVHIPEIEYKRLYDVVTDDRIADYKATDDALWKREKRAMHDIGEPEKYTRGRWNAIGRDIYYSNQPTYVMKGLGVSAVTFRPVAKVRISSTYWYLYIDIPLTRIFKTVSKNAKRKAIRYGRMSQATSDKIDKTVNATVNGYINQQHIR